MKPTCPVAKSIALGVSIIVNVAFIVFLSWNYLRNYVYATGFQKAQESTIAQLIQTAQKCVPFDVFIGNSKVQLQMLGCNKNAEPKAEATIKTPSEK